MHGVYESFTKNSVNFWKTEKYSNATVNV